MSLTERNLREVLAERAAPVTAAPEQAAAVQARARRQRRRNTAVTAIGLVAVIAVGLPIARHLGAGFPAPSVTPLQHVTPTPSVNGRTRIDLKVPVTVTVTKGFTRRHGLPGATMVFFSTPPPGRAMSPGVLVQEGAIPIWLDPAVTPRVGYGVTTARDPSAGSTPTSVAHWLATRPYLQVTSLSNTTLSGRPAVRLDLKRNSRYRYPYGSFLPVFDGMQTWLDTGQEARLWLIDLPDVGLTLVWSSTGMDHADLDKSLPLVESISFG
jgi:hypothetical protein